MQMIAATDGTTSTQTEIMSVEQKFFQGTYASRIYLSDDAFDGIASHGDKLVQAFFTITPLAFNMDPAYAEIDFEYLPNGGWGVSNNVMFETTWETYQGDPWIKDGISDWQQTSFAGWHTLVFTVMNSVVNYYIDGQLVASHGGKYYPEGPMFLSFQHWFIAADNSKNTARSYEHQVDWVYFAENVTLSPQQVAERVAQLTAENVHFKDEIQ